MIRVLCYGDSNTHGRMPMRHAHDVGRHPPADRWPGVAQAILGKEFDLIEEGLPGRTTVHDDPFEGSHKNGLSYLRPCLDSHWPLDVVVVMLGTNDLKSRFGLMPNDIASGVDVLLNTINGVTNQVGMSPKLIVVASVPIMEVGWLGPLMFEGGASKSKGLAMAMKSVADQHGALFFDAGSVARVSSIDGVHLDTDDQRVIGRSLAKIIKKSVS